MLESFAYLLFNFLLWLLIDPEGHLVFWLLWTLSMVTGLYLTMWMWPGWRSRDADGAR